MMLNNVMSAARRLSLAWRSRMCAVQAWRNSAPVSATQSPAVPDWLGYAIARTSLVDSDYALPVVTCHLLLVPRYQLSSLGRRSMDVCIIASYRRPWSVLRCRWINDLEFAVGWPPRSDVVTSLSDVHWKHFCSLSTSVSSALEVIYDDALYKSTLSIYLSIYLFICL